jgi:hypothetical protein
MFLLHNLLLLVHNHRGRVNPGRDLVTALVTILVTGPWENPEIGNFYLFLILISNLVSKVLY